jgi:hypothetical protein
MQDTTLFEHDTAFSFRDPSWRRFPQKKREEIGLAGNDLWGNKSIPAGALTCPASDRSDKFAVSQAGLNYLYEAVQRGEAITSGEVVLSGWDDKRHINYIILCMDVVEIFDKLKDIPPRQGKYGPFWLVYRDGTPEDENVPF